MNILITGSNGNIGSYLTKYFSKYHNVMGLSRDQMDIRNKDKTLYMIKSIKPDIVIHCAALTNIDFCENHETEAYTVNTLGSLNVAYACSSLNIPMVYLSSSDIFDGNSKTEYYETDECNPLNVYGKTKLAGEKLIRTICKRYFIIRTSWVFGGENCYIKKSLENLGSPIFICTDQVVNPTYIEDLCYSIEKIMVSDIYGIYNCVNKNSSSKLDVIKHLFSILNIEKPLMEIPNESYDFLAPRGKNLSLNTDLINNCFNLTLPTWQNRLENYILKLYQ